MTPLLCRPSEAREMLDRFKAGVEASRAICRRDLQMPEKVRKLAERGFTKPQIARIVDRDITTVRHHCKRLGIETRKGKPGRPVGAINRRLGE